MSRLDKGQKKSKASARDLVPCTAEMALNDEG